MIDSSQTLISKHSWRPERRLALTFSIALGYVLLVPMSFVTGRSAGLQRDRTQWQTRCGWFSNPTPANAWLQDKDGEWTIAVQGGHQADGDWPAFKRRHCVRTNHGGAGQGWRCRRAR